jgi:hypothetical protein
MIRRWTLLLVIAALAGLAPSPADAKRMTVRVPPFEVQPRSNREICVFVPLPAGTDSLDISEVVMSNRGGNEQFATHHLIVYAWTGDLGALANQKNAVIDDTACLNFGDGNPTNLQIVATAQGVNSREKMPSGTALELTTAPLSGKKRAVGFVLNSHWINGSDEVQKARAKVTFVTAKKSKVQRQLNPIFDVIANGTLFVPPGATRKTFGTWGPGRPDLGTFLGGALNPKGGACVTMIIGHMHRRGTLFTADYVKADGSRERIYSNTKYSDPPAKRFDPPLLVRPGEGISYECTQDNVTDTRLGCEETAGVTPGRSVIDQILAGGGFAGGLDDPDGSAKLCHTAGPNPDECPTGDGRFTGNCVPANLVFGFLSDDDMCIMPGYYYDADLTKPAGQECQL